MTARLMSAADSAGRELAAELLGAGEIVAIPTETVYGLAVLPRQESLARLVEVKRRSTEKGIQLLIDSLDQARAWVELPPAAERLARRFWPGALTLVLPQAMEVALPELLTGGRGTVGLRLPDHELPRELARRLGPICASSANISGEPPATDAQRVMAALAHELALVLDDGPVRGGVASTVVALPADGSEPQILREGALPAAEVLAVAQGD